MKKRSASISATTTSSTATTPILGLDVGDRTTHFCLLQGDQVIERGSFPTTLEQLVAAAKKFASARVVLEAGSQSPWMSSALRSLGMLVHVVDPRRIKLISSDPRKTDRRDAETLARLERGVPELLGNIHHRGKQAQHDLALLRSREKLVDCRTSLVLLVRSICKASGVRLKSASTEAFPKRVRDDIPDGLNQSLDVVLDQIAALTKSIDELEKRLTEVADTRYPEVALLRQVPGVGPITATTFVLTIEDPSRFKDSRQVGSYLGLAPRCKSSGDSNPQLPISKSGDKSLRRLLVQSAHHILGRFGPDSDLRRFGLRMAPDSRNKTAKKKAVVAVARKLAVLLHRLWSRGLEYEPLHAANRRAERAAS